MAVSGPGVRRRDGEERWDDEHDEQMVRPPTATESGVVVPTRTGVTVYEADGGDVRWTGPRRERDRGCAAVAEGRVFVTDGTESLYALDLETGDDEWSVSFSHVATPVVADGVVYVSRGIELVAFDAETGEQRFAREAERYFSPPAVGDGVLYVVDGDRVLALEEGA